MKNKKTYDLYVSLGAACSCTGTLRARNLQHYSYPFDWLYGSTLPERVNILVNDFKDWINKEDLEYVGNRLEPEPCDIYANKRTGIVFNHDFPLEVPLDDSWTSVNEKYTRRIERLLEQIQTSNNVLFVYMETPAQQDILDNNSLQEIHKTLKNRFPETNIDILYIYNSNNISYKAKKIIECSKNITVVSFDYNGYVQNQPWAINKSQTVKLFKNYKITGKHLSRKAKLKKCLKNIFSVKNKYTGKGKYKIVKILGRKISLKWNR